VNPFVDFDPSPASLQLFQLALAFAFLTSYAVTLGSFCERRGKLRAAGIALLALVVFCATVTPWAMGVVWAALAVGAMGGFVAITVLTSRLLGLDGSRTGPPPQADAVGTTRRAMNAPARAAYTVPGGL
jgi:hypothetical protein